MIEFDVKRFKELFPHLAKEIFEGSPRFGRDPLEGFLPGPVDYIRRCGTIKEAEEVINYLERKGEISKEEAEKLRKQLREKGLESFGPRKTPGYYFRYAAGLEK